MVRNIPSSLIVSPGEHCQTELPQRYTVNDLGIDPIGVWSVVSYIFNSWNAVKRLMAKFCTKFPLELFFLHYSELQITGGINILPATVLKISSLQTSQ